MMLPTGSCRALEATLALRSARAVPWLHLCCDMMTVAPWNFARLHLETRSGAVWYRVNWDAIVRYFSRCADGGAPPVRSPHAVEPARWVLRSCAAACAPSRLRA
jgi:hypothetical protein